MTDTLATKQDLVLVRQDIRDLETRTEAGFAAVRHEIRELGSRTSHELRELESRMEVRSADLERRMTLRLGGLMMAGIAVVSALNRLG
jgi:hypothetical protein